MYESCFRMSRSESGTSSRSRDHFGFFDLVFILFEKEKIINFALPAVWACSPVTRQIRLGRGWGGSYFPNIVLNEIQTMFSPLAERSARVLPADLCTDHVHYVKNHRSTVLRRNKNMADEGRTVSRCYILVIPKFIDFMSLFRHNVWISFSVKQLSSAEFVNMQHIAAYSC